MVHGSFYRTVPARASEFARTLVADNHLACNSDPDKPSLLASLASERQSKTLIVYRLNKGDWKALMTGASMEAKLDKALTFRAEFFDERHEAAFRLFNGFTEGNPDLVLDLYAKTLVVHNYADRPQEGLPFVRIAQQFITSRLPWIGSVVVKTRNSPNPHERCGSVVQGKAVDRKIRENATWYAIDPMINRDTSLYLDTRNVRLWARQHLRDKSVLNTFAYTGSLGVAAKAGGAERVIHVELNRRFLNLAKTSYTLNGFPINKKDFRSGDFWPQINRLKAAGELFDCVFLDPPIYSATSKGIVDLALGYKRLINKVRPLIKHEGHLIAINNALFVSGAAYVKEIESLCADGYLTIEELIPVPADFIGDPGTSTDRPVTDPAPFNHSTKIVVLRVRRKGVDITKGCGLLIKEGGETG